jgi:hypothetical protein
MDTEWEDRLSAFTFMEQMYNNDVDELMNFFN